MSSSAKMAAAPSSFGAAMETTTARTTPTRGTAVRQLCRAMLAEATCLSCSPVRSLSSPCGLAVNCPATRGPGDRCAPEQFECLSDRTCIPASYHCDEEPDCPDRSDEYGCSKSGKLRLLAAATFRQPAFVVSLRSLSSSQPLPP